MMKRIVGILAISSFIGALSQSAISVDYDYAKNQLKDYQTATDGLPIDLMTNDNGEPIEYQSATSTINTNLLDNRYFMDSVTHMSRERIPDRTVHSKGNGAFGYFQVTNDVTKYIRAKFLQNQSSVTPVAVRFSFTFEDKGSSDATRGGKGMAVKFYTEEGNLDLIGVTTPIFGFKDPVVILPFNAAHKRNPVTFIPDVNALWDFVTRNPAHLNILLRSFSDSGNPDGFRNIDAYTIHTFEVENSQGDLHYVRFSFLNNQGSNYLSNAESAALALTDPNYYTRDLYNAIARGDFPSWTLNMQVMTYDQVKNATFDAFSVTKHWPIEQYPYQEIGRLVLNRNPTNYFNDVEQAAFCVSNLVPGINGGVDTMYQARILAYKDTQHHRLGPNFLDLPVNKAIVKVNSYNRDGYSNAFEVGSGPNYYPNSFNGPEAYNFTYRSSESLIGKLLFREKLADDDVFGQSYEYYEGKSEEERQRIAGIFATVLSRVTVTSLQEKALGLLTELHPELGQTVAYILAQLTTG